MIVVVNSESTEVLFFEESYRAYNFFTMET